MCITLGIVCLTLGFAWLLSLMAGRDSYVLSQLSLMLQGLCGPLCPIFALLVIWGGAKLMVSARHRVSVRTYVIVVAIYLMVLAGYTLAARVQQNGEVFTYLDYVNKQNYISMPLNHDSFAAYLYQAYAQRTSGAGGLLGMLLAYPLSKILSRIGALMLIAVGIIVLLFLLFRLNPGDLFRSASDHGEQRRVRRMQRQREKDQQRAALEAQKQAQQEAQAPVVQEYAMEEVRPGQTVERQDTVYAPPAYYQPAPVYDAHPAYQQVSQPSAQEQGFYPVQPDLYDERFPLHDAPNPAWQEEAPQQPAAQQPSAPVHAPEPVHASPVSQPAQQHTDDLAGEQPDQEKPSRLRALRRSRIERRQDVQPERPAAEQAEQHSYAPETPAAQPRPETQTVPEKKQSVTAKPAVSPSFVPDEEVEDVDDLPWDVPPKPASAKEQPRPAPVSPVSHANKPAASDWVNQVRRKEAEISQDLPAHTTAKNEPKPVYTDPVMPITNERIPITPRKESTDAKLDGTSAPKVQQGSMGIPVPYQAPPIRLLNEGKHVPLENTAHEDEQRAQIIENTLRSFGVESEVKQIMHGPAITRFAIQIAPGVKVSRVANTAENLALDLKTKHVRVEAPIQGTSYIDIEVPNQLVSTVSLRDVLDSPEMHNNPSPLLVALGKDIAGAPILCDLSKMPHLLIAGATGSGKSVCINSIVCSLLYRTSPEQVRLIMIDPKQVELSVYNSIPHLLVPVVSDPRKAAGALSWVVQEMLERYGKFSAQGVRNLAGYNKVNQGTDQVLPNIVVIIDEMADLMEVCRKDVEESIRRLAALARAAGIYMVLATQRPSVDVITGVIKNNIPSRIAFAVSSGTDSRTIIDINGAEKLMGKGDMLYKPAGTSPVRVQGCFVSDEEVNAIAAYIGSRYQTDYDPNIVEHLDNAGKEQHEADETTGFDDGNGSTSAEGGSFNDLLQQAMEMAVEDGQTSTSMLQRRLRVGYARAGRLIDEMEKRGIISQSEGSKPRKTLITREQYYEMFQDE